MIIELEDERLAAERIVRLVRQYALRFDPGDQARFYARVVRGLIEPMRFTPKLCPWSRELHSKKADPKSWRDNPERRDAMGERIRIKPPHARTIFR